MADKFRLKVWPMEIRQMLNSEGAISVCRHYAQQVAGRAGSGYDIRVKHSTRRGVVFVYPATAVARRDNLQNNSLLKAL